MRWSPIRPDRVDPVTGCHEWQGATNGVGYGQRTIKDRHVYTHRLAWEEAHGPIPAGMRVCHRCDNPPCRNVDHLFLGTQSENMLDASTKGRLNGRTNWNAAKTHCKRGHAFDEENTYLVPPDYRHRQCRICMGERSARAAA